MKTLVISGGSSGIGEACINKFLANGYIIYNLDIVDNPGFTQITRYNYLATDVCSESAVKSALDTLSRLAVNIGVLIISAGKHLSAKIEDTSTEMLEQILNLNLLGAWWLIKYSLPLMKNNGGSIVTIGSDQSSIAKTNSAAYGMTKAALAHLTKSTALDYAKYNIRANCIGAGTIDTPLYRQAIASYAQTSGIALEQIEAEEAACQPLNRIGNASEVAELAYILSQDSLAYITGTLIPLDGGYIAR